MWKRPRCAAPPFVSVDKRDLRKREDEHEVEEELERCDAVLALGVLPTHSPTLARSEPAVALRRAPWRSE